MATILCTNTQKELDVDYGTTLLELSQKENITLENKVLGALVNNQIRSLGYKIHKPSVITFFDITSTYGHDMYFRSIYFILFKAIHDLYPEAHLKILHSISGGKYCEIDQLPVELTQEVIDRICCQVDSIIARNIPFERKDVHTHLALEMYEKSGLSSKSDIFRERKRLFTTIYQLDDVVNYYYSHLLPSTGYITMYKIELYESGIILKIPSRKRPDTISQTRRMPKLFAVYKEFKSWATQMGVPYVADINKRIEKKDIQNLILQTEAYQEKLWANTADEIKERNNKIVLISGPSSSGKTTTCKRMSIQLSILGYKPIEISVDDFFLERTETPLDENGEYDFETIDAIDINLFNNTLKALLDGKEVELPTFNFTTGQKEWTGKKCKMEKESILIIEGIHCLNPKLTEQIDDSWKYKIFVSALTSLSIDMQNPIPTSDNRLLRRIIRDYNYRGYSASDTIKRWPSVRNGEEKYIFPFQENADRMFNTSLLYELGVLFPYAIPILLEVPETSPEYPEALRLLKFLSYFKPIPENLIPGTSILREFLGGSKFKY